MHLYLYPSTESMYLPRPCYVAVIFRKSKKHIILDFVWMSISVL